MKNLLKDESGASLAEYALLLTIASLALVGAVQALRGGIVTRFNFATLVLGGEQ